VTQAAGVFNPEGKSLGVALVDFNADGWLDIAVANDTEPNLIHRNNANGSFTEEAVLRGLAFDENGRARGGMGIDVADYLNNGKLAISIGNFSNEKLAFFYTSDSEYFSDEALRVGVGAISFLYLTFGLFFFDYDLDGYLDLFAANGHIETDVSQIQPSLSYAQRPLLFKNLGRGSFIELAQQCGDLNRAGVSRGAAYGDYDSDGDLDLLVSNNGVYSKEAKPWLLQNDGGNNNNFLRAKLIGTKSNRDGIGAKVFVRAANINRAQMVKTGSSYCSQSELSLTFGLEKLGKVDSVKIIWPSGQVDEYYDIKANSSIKVIEGKGCQLPRTNGF
jgi:hypothetical protein